MKNKLFKKCLACSLAAATALTTAPDVGILSPVAVYAQDAAQVTAAPAGVDNLVYTGSEQELITAGTATGGTMKYFASSTAVENFEDVTFSEELPKRADAGTYYVYYMVEAEDDGEDVAASTESKVVVTISKASFISDETSESGTYTYETSKNASLSVDVSEQDYAESFESLSGVTVAYGGTTLTADTDYTVSDIEVDDDATKGTFTLSGIGNYT